MADQVQWRGGSRQNSDQFTGAPREVTVDTSDWILRVHDGVTPGGHKMMKVNDCLKVETADKCNPNAPSCQVTVNGLLDVNGDIDLDGNLDMLGDLNIEGDITVLGKHDVTLTGDLNVEGDTNVDDLHVTGCISNPSDPCGVNEPVVICDDLHVKGDVTIDGTIDLGDIVIDLETDDVMLKNPGDYVADCNVPNGNGLKTQADANKWFYEGIRILDEKLCIAQKEIQVLETQYQQLENRVEQNEIDIAALKKEIENLKQEIIDIENAIKLLEVEIENNANAILDHEGRISYLEAQVNQIIQDLADLAASIGDGKITLANSDGSIIGDFTVNQKGDTTITIPAAFTGSWNDLTDKPTEFPPAPHDHTLAELTDTAVGGQTDGQALIWDDSQKLWINSDIPESGISQGDLDAALLAQKLDDHVDVTVPNPKDKDYLSWDDRLQLWVATSPFALPPAVQFKGVLNLAGPAPMNPKPGDAWIHHDPNITRQDDTVIADGSWSGIGGETIHEGEYVIYSTDDEWHHTGGGSVELSELQSDWNQVDPLEPDYIHNKPDIPAIIDAEAGDGQINVNAGDGLAAAGNNATANQKGDTTRTLSVKTGDGLAIDVNGNVIIDPNFNLDGNITPPGDGSIQFNAGPGLAESGTNATANQTVGTVKSFSVKTGDGLSIDANGNVIIDPNYNLDGNVTAPNDGVLTVKDHTGATVGTFTANQAGNTDVTLPEGFSGEWNDLNGKPTEFPPTSHGHGWGEITGKPACYDPCAHRHEWSELDSVPTEFPPSSHIHSYNDLTDKPTIPTVNDGRLTIKNSDGSTAGTFTANQVGNTEVTMAEGFSGDWNDLNNVPTEFPPSNHTHSYNDLTDKPDINDGKLTIKNSDGTVLGEFTANQATNADCSLDFYTKAEIDALFDTSCELISQDYVVKNSTGPYYAASGKVCGPDTIDCATVRMDGEAAADHYKCGDELLVTFVDGSTDARKIIFISKRSSEVLTDGSIGKATWLGIDGTAQGTTQVDDSAPIRQANCGGGSGADFPEAPADGNVYVRDGLNETWVRGLPYDLSTLPIAT